MSPNPLPLDPGVFSKETEADACDCDGECCHDHSILLTHIDVERILMSVDIDPRELLVFFEAHEGYADLAALGGYPALQIEGGPCYMGLRFVSDSDDARRHCRFLDHITHGCSIHAFKPMICRIYPFIVDGGLITRHGKIRCMRPYHPKDARDLDTLRRVLDAAYSEFDEYKDKVARWNETEAAASFEAFFTRFFKF